jgi:2-polyprenyl-6-methoxyphenol hydroxylase-like FAD-dependent oxidoreductase
MKLDKKIVIIGGGIGGLAMANALQQAGFEYDLYEQAPELTDVGAGIGLSGSAMEVLDRLGLGDDVRDTGIAVKNVYLANKQLKIRRKMDVQQETACIHRALLIDILKDRLSTEKIHLSKQATDIKSHQDYTEVFFSDGSSVRSQCLIAADGIHSVIRKKLYPDIKVRYINQTIWRGITRLEAPDAMKNSYFEIWDEGLRFLTVPYRPDEIFWLAVRTAPPGGTDNPETIRDELIDLFGNFHPVLKTMISESQGYLRNDMADLGTFNRPWSHNRVVFLGDSIHATTPNLAQGGCQAIEDAFCLSLCLKSYFPDFENSFNTYHRLRHDKVMDIVKTSWQFGKAAHSRNPFLHYFYRFLLEYAPKALLRIQEQKLNDLRYLEELYDKD